MDRTRDQLIADIVRKEWHMFDQVHNEGGRADCQDDWTTFSIMRTSQMEAWQDDTLLSYDQDLDEAVLQQRNLLEEKYARMMASTQPEAYVRLEPMLPPISDEKRTLVDSLVNRQMQALEQLKPCYPHVLASMRSLYTSQDTPDATSLETYQRGELLTYSLRTLRCYERQLAAPGYDYGRQVLEDTARSYGFPSLDALEERLGRKENKP